MFAYFPLSYPFSHQQLTLSWILPHHLPPSIYAPGKPATCTPSPSIIQQTGLPTPRLHSHTPAQLMIYLDSALSFSSCCVLLPVLDSHGMFASLERILIACSRRVPARFARLTLPNEISSTLVGVTRLCGKDLRVCKLGLVCGAKGTVILEAYVVEGEAIPSFKVYAAAYFLSDTWPEPLRQTFLPLALRRCSRHPPHTYTLAQRVL
ncbi:hypothetical protein JB92DRAFT_1306437 [Gautieria morchelliformis]|nr:hypothetical protein JB92DRAFT_1306437 [Gautieria morchelliformis]